MAGFYNPPAIFAGDTWPGLLPFTITVNSAPPASAATSARMIFFKAETGISKPPALELKTPDQITILNAPGWQFSVPPAILPLAPGEWTYRFSVTDAAGTVLTWLTGTITLD